MVLGGVLWAYIRASHRKESVLFDLGCSLHAVYLVGVVQLVFLYDFWLTYKYCAWYCQEFVRSYFASSYAKCSLIKKSEENLKKSNK